jgi:hypothetical protein
MVPSSTTVCRLGFLLGFGCLASLLVAGEVGLGGGSGGLDAGSLGIQDHNGCRRISPRRACEMRGD